MRTGRPKNWDKVISLPTASANANYERQQRVAQETAEKLKPKGLPADVSAIWDREAPRFAHPMVGRLTIKGVTAFKMFCESLARYEISYKAWEEKGRVYQPGEGRNGNQIRHLPEFAQMNTFLKQAMDLGGRFGWTPHDDRSLTASAPEPHEAGDDFS